MSEIAMNYDAVLNATIEDHFADEFDKFVLGDDAYYLRSFPNSVNLLRQVNVAKVLLEYYQNAPHDEIVRNRVRDFNEDIIHMERKISELNGERILLEDSLNKLSKMTFSKEGLLEHLMSTMTAKINSSRERVELFEIRIADIEERKAKVDAQKIINERIKMHQREINSYERLILHNQQLSAEHNESYRELMSQLDNS